MSDFAELSGCHGFLKANIYYYIPEKCKTRKIVKMKHSSGKIGTG